MKKFQPTKLGWLRYRLGNVLIALGQRIRPPVPIALDADGDILYGRIDTNSWRGIDGTVGKQDG